MLKYIIIIFIIFFSTNTNGQSSTTNSTTSRTSAGVSAKITPNQQVNRVQVPIQNPGNQPPSNNGQKQQVANQRRRKKKEAKKVKKRGSSSFPTRYSYSGADCKAVAYFNDNTADSVNLESLATISYSVYEAKSPVRRLGERSVAGYTKGIRTIAGSIVFLVIEDHPLAELVKSSNLSKMWSSDLEEKGHSNQIIDGQKRYLSTMLEPFNIGLFYRTEVSFIDNNETYEYSTAYINDFNEMAHLVIEGVEIISEGMVTSVNDMVTEITMQFVAHDVFNIEKKESAKIEIGAEKKENIKESSSKTNPSTKEILSSTDTNNELPANQSLMKKETIVDQILSSTYNQRK